MKPNVLIISYVSPYNRQGYDLAECLRGVGCRVHLLQQDGITDASRGIIGVRIVKPHGRLHFMHMLCNFLFFLHKSLRLKKDVVICVGRPMLTLGGLYKILLRSKLIWYSLEYGKLGLLERFVYNHCVDGYIDVEVNRRDAFFKAYGHKQHSLVCHNMPHKYIRCPHGGKLREYLANFKGISPNVKIVIYAGSYQKYARIDKILEASRSFPKTCVLVLLLFGWKENSIRDSVNCVVVPPVRGEEFYDWLVDADCALLPYEDDDDFNVLCCSPQKLFDCYLVGVPFVASNRPIIRESLDKCPEAGSVCDFNDSASIVEKCREVLDRGRSCKTAMRSLHLSEFNYGTMESRIADLIDSIFSAESV